MEGGMEGGREGGMGEDGFIGDNEMAHMPLQYGL